MTIIRGIENPATACHVSCPLLVLAYGVTPALARAITAAAPLQSSPFWHAWARVLRQLLLQQQDDNGDETMLLVEAVNPDEFYTRIQDHVGICPHELGDAVTSLAKLLHVLRQDEFVGKLVKELFYAGRCVSVITGQQRDDDADAKMFRRRIKTTQEKSLPVPFSVPTDDKTDSLHQLLLRSLAARPMTGYQWSPTDDFEETTVASCPNDFPANDDSLLDHDDDCNGWQTSRQLKVRNLGPYWLIHVDHFSRVRGRVRSRQIPCAIPLELDASNYCQLAAQEEEQSHTYHLTSAILHLSSTDGDDEEEDGHFTAVVRSSRLDSNGWVLIDDTKTTDISQETCLDLLAGCHSKNLSEHGSYVQASLLVFESTSVEERVEPILNELLARIQETKFQQESLVGRRLEILWSKGKFYAGMVASFDPTTGRHTIRYDDGDVRAYTLAKKTIRWLDVSDRSKDNGLSPN